MHWLYASTFYARSYPRFAVRGLVEIVEPNDRAYFQAMRESMPSLTAAILAQIFSYIVAFCCERKQWLWWS